MASVLLGLLAGVILGGLNSLIAWETGFDATSFAIMGVVPLGAFFFGMASAFLSGAGVPLKYGKKSLPFWRVGWFAVVGTLALVLSYLFMFSRMLYEEDALFLQNYQFFPDYLNEVFQSFEVSVGDGVGMGKLGILVGYADFIAAGVGGVFGGIAGHEGRRRSAGVSAIPPFFDDIAGVFASIIRADGVVLDEEVAQAHQVLAMVAQRWYEETEAGQQGAVLIGHISEKLTAQLNASDDAASDLKAHLPAIPTDDPAVKMLVVLGAVAIARCDGEPDPTEQSILDQVEAHFAVTKEESDNAHKIGIALAEDMQQRAAEARTA